MSENALTRYYRAMATLKHGIALQPTTDPDKIIAMLYEVLESASAVLTAELADGAVTAAKLATALDLSSKTLTLPNGNVTAAKLADILDLSSKTLTLPDGNVSAAKLAAAVQDRIAYVSAAAVDGEDGTATLTLQLKDAGGNNLAEHARLRVWVGTANDLGVDAITGISATTGTVVDEHTVNGDYNVLTDENGAAVLTLDNGGAGTIYAWVELNGRIVAVGAIVITAAE